MCLREARHVIRPDMMSPGHLTAATLSLIGAHHHVHQSLVTMVSVSDLAIRHILLNSPQNQYEDSVFMT